MTKRQSLILVWAVALAGCGSGASSSSRLCDKAAQVASRVAVKFSPCLSAPPNGDNTGIATGQTCQNQLANCNEDDMRILDGVLDCFDGLPTCSTATKSDFFDTYQRCIPSPTGLSATCTALN